LITKQNLSQVIAEIWHWKFNC